MLIILIYNIKIQPEIRSLGKDCIIPIDKYHIALNLINLKFKFKLEANKISLKYSLMSKEFG
jgi:hypothetical protein